MRAFENMGPQCVNIGGYNEMSLAFKNNFFQEKMSKSAIISNTICRIKQTSFHSRIFRKINIALKAKMRNKGRR